MTLFCYQHEDFKKLFLFFLISILLSLIIFCLSYIITIKDSYTEKLSTYECGFEPYEDARNQFDVQFYLIALIYLIFDVEVIFLYPWALLTTDLSKITLFTIIDFMIELWVGFIFIWRTHVLTWSSSI